MEGALSAAAATPGALWGAEAETWARLGEISNRPLWIAMLDAAAVGPGTRCLDAGCGAGGASLLAAERGAQVSGLDASAPLITVARRRLPSGEFRVGELERSPY